LADKVSPMQNPDPPKDTVQHQAASAQHVLQVHLAHRASAAHKELWPLHQSHGPRVDSTHHRDHATAQHAAFLTAHHPA